MPYGNLNVDVVQSSTAGTPPQFNDGNGVQVGTLCRAWVNFNASSGTSAVIRTSFNVSSVTRNSAGDYTVNFTTAFSDANYTPLVSTGNSTTTNSMCISINSSTGADVAPTTTAFRFALFRRSDGANQDATYLSASVFR